MAGMKNALDKILGWFCIIIFSFMVLMTTYQVIVRYVFSNPSALSETLTKYAFVWLILYSSAYVFGQRDHISINFVKDKQKESTKRFLNIFIELIVIIFACLVMVYGGIRVSSMNLLQFDSILNVPTGYIYSAIPLSGILIIIYSIYNILIELGKEEV